MVFRDSPDERQLTQPDAPKCAVRRLSEIHEPGMYALRDDWVRLSLDQVLSIRETRVLQAGPR